MMFDWYLIIRAAKNVNSTPWELLDQSIFWYHKSLEAELIDAEVDEARAEQARAEAQVNR